MVDLKNQTDNLRLLLASVEAELSQKQEQAALADTTEAWLYALRERLEEIEEDTKEAFRSRQQLVKLLVKTISVDKRPEDGRTEIRITYHFEPPTTSKDYPEDYSSVASFKNGREFCTPTITVPTLTIVAVK